MRSATREPLLNSKLAEYLRREGLDAVEEQTVRGPDGSRPVIDILVDLDNYAVAIEAEYAPRDGRSDAISRLTEPELHWRGLPVRAVYAVTYPAALKQQPPADAYKALGTTGELSFTHRFHPNVSWSEDYEIPHSHDWSTPMAGGVKDLAEVLRNYWAKTDTGASIDAIVDSASEAISLASDSLNRVRQFGEKGSDPAATKALVWLNALLFQELLAVRLDPSVLPPEFQLKGIPRPDPEQGATHLARQWKTILEINWWPIFHVARESLNRTPGGIATLALDVLKPAARAISDNRVIERHDISGRIFHRLLDTRKFLATNYTTIPSAILLAGLAFDDNHHLWTGRDFGDTGVLEKLKVVDPACGSGTLLMAALQEVLKRSRRSNQSSEDKEDFRSTHQASLTKTLLEDSLYGFDVVPAAIHLAASTLSMSETSQLIAKMNLWRMRHGIYNNRARLGSLDLLSTSDTKGNAARLGLFESDEDAYRIHGKGEDSEEMQFPSECDLIIANPPYTRAGGPGDQQNTAWNPIFGSLMDDADQKRMNQSLKRALSSTPAGVYSGLGSAFIVLADENIREGGRIAFVLPATAVTGSSWRPIRSLLLKNYELDWIVTCHDPRQRSARAELPGRIFSSFSESTTISETLLVATKARLPSQDHVVRFLNLRTNITETLDAIVLARSLLEMPAGESEVVIGKKSWGEIQYIEQSQLHDKEWIYNAFVQSKIVTIVDRLLHKQKLGNQHIPLVRLGNGWQFGPYEMQIKHPKQGLFHCDDRPNMFRPGYPALWHHSAKNITTMGVRTNAWLTPKSHVPEEQWKSMLDRGSRLQMARELRHNTQRLNSVLTDKPMLGVRSWISLKSANPREGDEETLCLWLNSTLGLLLRIAHGNRPYPGRSQITHTTGPDLLVLDIDALSSSQLRIGKIAYERLCNCKFQSVHLIHQDESRRKVDRALTSVLEGGLARQRAKFTVAFKNLADAMVLEPNISAREI